MSEKTIYVRGLSYSVDKEDLKRVFEKFGKIKSIRLPEDEYTGEAIGYALITFEDDDSARKSLNLSGKSINGRAITVKIKKSKEQLRKKNSSRNRQTGLL